MATAAPQLGYVRIRSVDPPITILCRLAQDRPNITAGMGGWTEVTRPRRRSLSVWSASPGLRMDLPILLDRFVNQASVELQISQIERLAGPNASDGSPSRLRLSARGNSVPFQGRVWVIDAVTFGDALVNAKGNRVRQQITLGLLEYIADVRLDQNSPSQAQRAKKKAITTKAGAAQKRIVAGRGRAKVPTKAKAGAHTVQIETGDDLVSIAAKELGDPDRWREIANLNNIRDPRSIKVGQELRLP